MSLNLSEEYKFDMHTRDFDRFYPSMSSEVSITAYAFDVSNIVIPACPLTFKGMKVIDRLLT